MNTNYLLNPRGRRFDAYWASSPPQEKENQGGRTFPPAVRKDGGSAECRSKPFEDSPRKKEKGANPLRSGK